MFLHYIFVRTLDQHCTVIRSADSNIAASILVELFVSLLQHEKNIFAVAHYQLNNKYNEAIELTTILGLMPRGYLNKNSFK